MKRPSLKKYGAIGVLMAALFQMIGMMIVSIGLFFMIGLAISKTVMINHFVVFGFTTLGILIGFFLLYKLIGSLPAKLENYEKKH